MLSRAGLVLLALISALFLLALDRFPAVIGGDEAHFAVHAESLARSGHDLNGTKWPVFVRITDPLVPNNSSNIWYQPLLFYVMMPFVAAFGPSAWAIRLPVALIAVASLWLMYAVGLRMFRDRRLAVAAALGLALTPALFIVSRQALDYIAPLPFVLAWLLFFLKFLDEGRIRDAALAGLSLGLALFSYIAAWVLMPVHLVLMLAVMWQSAAPQRTRAIAAATAAFAGPAIALTIALASNSEMLSNTLSRYEVADAATSQSDVAARLRLYWDYFNPSFLFFAGGSNPTQATSRVGVFLLGFLPLMLIGVRAAWLGRRDRDRIALVALAVAPLPIAVTMPPAAAYSIARAMTMLPFGVLIAVVGLEAARRNAKLRPVAIVCLMLIPLQFAAFLQDYRGGYQLRAAPRLDPANMRAVGDAVIALDSATPAPAVYLSDRIDDGGVRWRLLMSQHGRADLWTRSRSLSTMQALPAIEPNALVICTTVEPTASLLRNSGYREVAAIAGADGEAAAVILRAPG
ncbi:MAG TPA: glycosyltransferase family 39 protein [Vicinamibacterales bacterium]|nr:glycosyltransferase family 39 protein [Vicinamibacterales bacterium]